MKKSHENYLKEVLQATDERGYLKHRESTTIEFKENFNFKNMPRYSKTMAAFTNNKGGYIIFGIKARPRKLLGIDEDKFNNLPQDKITTFLIEHFDPEIKWDIGMVEFDDKVFGYIYAYESDEKPIICKKNAGDDDIKSGEIYFRYRGQDRKIGYSELKRIIDEFREKERRMWMTHIERIAKIGPSNVALLDMMNGTINTTKLEGAKLVMDKALIDDLKEKVEFVEEGKFSEKEGEPTLKITGEIQTADVIIPLLDPDRDYPYLQKHLAEELGLRPYDVQVLIWKYKLKEDRKYHIEIQTSKSGKVHKYSRYALEFLNKKSKEQPNIKTFLKKVSREYQNRRRDR